MRRLLASLVFVIGCSHPQRPAMSQSECTLAIEGFASADPARLRGLPTTCTVDDVKAGLHSLDATSRGILASRDKAVTVHYFSSPKLQRIRAWVDDTTGRVLLLDTEWPPVSEDAYKHVLGKPEVSLGYPWHGNEMPDAELLWLERGIVIVANPKFLDAVLRVAVFAPGLSLDAYKQSVRYVDTDTTDDG